MIDFILSVALLALLACIYFLPSLAAHSKSRKNSGAILALNFLLGWTFLGWVVALIWAMTDDK